MEMQRQLDEGLRAIMGSGLPGVARNLGVPVWPSPMTPLVAAGIYHCNDEGRDHGEDSQESSWEISWRLKNITSGALYSSTSKRTLPTTSFVEEFKVYKARIYMMMWDFKYPSVKAAQSNFDSGGNWRVTEAVKEAGGRLSMKEVIRALQQDCRCLGWKKVLRWYRGSEGDQQLTVNDELRSIEEKKRVEWAMWQPQGMYWSWKSIVDKNVKWSDLMSMQQSHISFLLQSVYDILPTPSNLLRWKWQRHSELSNMRQESHHGPCPYQL